MNSPPIGAATGRAAEAVAEAMGAAVPAKTKGSSARNGTAEAAFEALASAAVPALVRAVRAGVAAASGSRAPVTGYATVSTAKRTSSSAAKGPLAFLKDPALSIEEKLLRLLSHLSEKWEKEMQAKLEQMGDGGGTSSSSSSSSGGLLKGVASAFSKALGGSATGIAGAALGALKTPAVRAMLEKLGGPVLGAAASAMGFPAAAPALIKYGGSIVGAAADVASSVGEAQGASTTGTGGKAISDAKRQQLTLEIQRLYEKQKEMFSLVSAISRVSHETRSAVIGNIR
jgi:hypothetical protein